MIYMKMAAGNWTIYPPVVSNIENCHSKQFKGEDKDDKKIQ